MLYFPPIFQNLKSNERRRLICQFFLVVREFLKRCIIKMADDFTRHRLGLSPNFMNMPAAKNFPDYKTLGHQCMVARHLTMEVSAIFFLFAIGERLGVTNHRHKQPCLSRGLQRRIIPTTAVTNVWWLAI